MPYHRVREFASVGDVDKRNRDVKAPLTRSEIQARMPGLGADAKPMTPRDLADATWTK